MDDFDGGGMSSPLLMMMGMAAPVFVSMAVITLFVPGLLYIIARWRQNREPVADPQLGIKFALGFFRQIGYQVVLLGGFMIIFAMIGKGMGGSRGMLMRPAFGLLVPGLIVWGVHNLAMQRTNRIQFPSVERLWAGYNLMTVGIAGFVALIMVFQSLFMKGDTGNFGRMAWAMALVYGSAWAVQGVIFLNRVLDAPIGPSISQSPPSAGSGTGGTADAPWSKPLS